MKKYYLYALVLLILKSFSGFCQIPNSTDQAMWESYFNKKIADLDIIEGVYKCNYSFKVINTYLYEKIVFENNYGPATIVIYRDGSTYKTKLLKTYHNGQSIDGFDLSRFVSFSFNTSSSNVNYSGEIAFDDNYTSSFNAEFSNGRLVFNYTVPHGFTLIKSPNNKTHREEVIQTWIKIYPDKRAYENIAIEKAKQEQKSTGTGFAISSNGYIATNYHVINGAQTIHVKEINPNYQRSFNAKVVVSDERTDLAILKIIDSSFTLDNVPYSIKTSLSDVGEDVFVLGFPLTETMGTEIKLTNGIISAKTGFQGDISTYQISVPIQPGNSGAPLFDSMGNLIGIVNAKHLLAENAGYAIKFNYLKNLVDLIDNPPTFSTTNKISTKSLPEKVKILSNFVFIISINE